MPDENREKKLSAAYIERSAFHRKRIFRLGDWGRVVRDDNVDDVDDDDDDDGNDDDSENDRGTKRHF